MSSPIATTAVVSGGCGFIGSNLCLKLADLGYKVIAFDNHSSSFKSNRSLLASCTNIQLITADACEEWAKFLGPLENVSLVFHFASPASPPIYQTLSEETMWVNSLGLAKGIEFADQYNARLIFASTSEVYGDPKITPQSEEYFGNVNCFGIRSCYDESKRFGEALLFTRNHRRKTRHGLVRIFNTYGPGMNPNDGRVVVNLLSQALSKKPLTIYGNGQQTRSFCFIEDLIEGIMKYALSGHCVPMNLGNPIEFTIAQLVAQIQQLFPEQALKTEYLPFPKDDPLQRCPDISRARQLLGWEPRIQLKDGLIIMKQWMEQLNVQTN